jgi:hypothetical protein
VLAQGAVAAVGRVARPVALVAFVAVAALAVTAAVFRRDAEWTPLWLLVATWLGAIWADAGSAAESPGASTR